MAERGRARSRRYRFSGIAAAVGRIETATVRRRSGAVVSREGEGMVSFVHDDEGQGLVEYALIIAVIAVAVIVALVFLRDQISNVFSDIGNNLT